MYQDYDFYPYQNYQPFNRMSSLGSFGGLFRRGRIKNGFSNMSGVHPKFDWGNFLSNTQKTLNVVNQAIPIFYQIKPIWSNAKTMFRIMGAIKDDDDEKDNTTIKFHPNKSDDGQQEKVDHNINNSENQPHFFL